jgi:hypothetical protein
MFHVKDLSFTRLEYDAGGEFLETSFRIENLTNVPIELYIFVVATFEKGYIPYSSFESLELEDRNWTKNFKPFPDDLTNFEYTDKDEKGEEKKFYYKYPKNIKAGIDLATGKPYHIEEKFIFRGRHFNPYGKNYYFFNTITILIFDAADEKLVFSQNYAVKPRR